MPVGNTGSFAEAGRYPAYGHCWLCPSVSNELTSAIAGNRHYTTGTIEGPLLYFYMITTERASDAFVQHQSYRFQTRYQNSACGLKNQKLISSINRQRYSSILHPAPKETLKILNASSFHIICNVLIQYKLHTREVYICVETTGLL